MAEREVLVDSGATDNFISKNLLHRLKIGYLLVENPIKIWNVDGTHNQDGAISHFTDLQMHTGTKTKTLRFLITNLGKDEVILGYPWLTAFEPMIHWKDATLDKECQPVVISSIKPEEAQLGATTTEEEWETLNTEEGPDAILRKTTTASELAQKAMDKTKKTFEQMVPEEYRRHARTFNEKESHRFPPERPWDHAIELLPDAPKSFDCKIYPMARGEEDSLWEFIKEQLEKGYIRPSKSPYASPFFFIKKKDGKLRLVQDYRKLNSLTVKNQYPLPLIPELIDRLRNATLFTKLDIRWGYNNVCIKEGDQEKGAFKTNLGLYEPCVMFFGLTNSPSTFQTMMDTIFRDLTATGEVVIYMDDILIVTSHNTPHHRQLVHQVLEKLEEHDLFLKPEKCTFEVPEIEYLRLVIGGGRVRMDRVKVQGVDGWKRPKNLTELRGWMGFINFYRRFIKGFSKIARVLNELRVEVANTRHRRCHPYKRCSERKQSLSGDPLQNDLSLICSSGLLSNSVLTPAGIPPLGEWGILLGSVNGTGTYFGDQSPNLLGNCPNL